MKAQVNNSAVQKTPSFIPGAEDEAIIKSASTGTFILSTKDDDDDDTGEEDNGNVHHLLGEGPMEVKYFKIN